jgi:hypothetical protein
MSSLFPRKERTAQIDIAEHQKWSVRSENREWGTFPLKFNVHPPACHDVRQ